MRVSPIILLIAAAAIAAPLAAQRGGPAFTVQETGQGFERLDEALAAVQGRDATIVIAPGTYRQCGRQEGGRVAFVAAEPGTVTFDGVACEGKGTLVLAGVESRVEGIVFQNITVPDGNGAGIRLESGSLTVVDSMFRDSQQGILTVNEPSIRLSVDHSTFSRLGLCSSDCSHSIYAGRIGALTVTNSRFERGTGGHYVKSRAARNVVADSSFDDSQGSSTNYMIDLSNGGAGEIVRNTFVVGASKENYTCLIAVAPEGVEHDPSGLVVADNTASLAPGVPFRTAFVADWSGVALRIGRNSIADGIEPFTRRQ